MAAIEALCSRSFELADGAVVAIGPTSDVIQHHLSRMHQTRRKGPDRRSVDDSLFVESVSLDGEFYRSGSGCDVEIAFSSAEAGVLTDCAILFISATGVRVAIVDLRQGDILPCRYEAGQFSITTRIKSLPFVEGEYSIGLALGTARHGDNLFDLCDLFVTSGISVSTVSYPANVRGFVELDAESCLSHSA
jgi:lipopolysaccharide transport system ATP-binding protein